MGKGVRTKYISFIVVILFLLSFSIFFITTKATTISLQRMYVKIDTVEVTDPLAGGTYTLKFGYKWKRHFSEYGDQFISSDSQYDDGWSGNPNWNTYPVSIAGGSPAPPPYYNDLNSYHCYAKTLPTSGYEIVMYVKLQKGISSQTVTFNIGSTHTYDYKYPTGDLWFSKYGGSLNIEFWIFDM